MKKFITGLLIGVLMLVSTAFADSAAKKLRKEGYNKIVYDILATHTNGNQYYGQGTAIGPHYILTASHLVRPSGNISRIEVLTKRWSGAEVGYKFTAAEVVKYGYDGSKEATNFYKDWAIVKTEKKLKYWKALETAEVEVGDLVYNVSGNRTLWGMIIPIHVVDVDPVVLANAWKKAKVYVTAPKTIGGDSGSPVFNENGALIGMVAGGNERISVLVKAKYFKRAIRKYSGR